MIPSDPPEPKFSWPTRWWIWLMDFWVWVKSKQPKPDINDFFVNEDVDGVRFSLRPSAVERAIADSSHPLKLVDATEGGVAKVRVVYGQTGGRPAKSTMTANGVKITLTATSVRYILAKITHGYSSPLWTDSASDIVEAASVTAKDATTQYFEIGHAEREANGSGGFRVKAGSIFNNVSGNQEVVRRGSASAYTDHHWKI